MNRKSGPRKWASAAWSWIGPGGNWKLVLGAITALAILAYVVSLKLNLAACRVEFNEYKASVAIEQQDALQGASTGRQSANATRNSDRIQISADTSAKRKNLNAALEANPDWASQPVPAAVVDSLR